jgi:hypothetical protein
MPPSQAPSAVGGACADASCEGGGEEPKEGSRTERRERLLVTPPKAALDVVGRLGRGNGAKLTPLASRLANSPSWRGFGAGADGGGGVGGGGGGGGCGGAGCDMSTIASEYATRKRQLGYGGEPSEPAPNVAASVARAPPPPATTFAVSQRWRAGRDTRLKARASAKKARQPRAEAAEAARLLRRQERQGQSWAFTLGATFPR